MKKDKGIFVGGLIEGIHYPKNKDHPIIDVEDCHGIIIVSVDYFLQNIDLLKSWAQS